MSYPKPLSADFYLRDDVVAIAKELLGSVLHTQWPGESYTSARIVETEAYAGVHDRASHSWNGRRTKRTEVMFGPGGHAYVYLCYGIHHLFNVVTNHAETPQAVLIRAAEPVSGVQTQLRRRKLSSLSPRISNGPGSLSMALGITTSISGMSLQGPEIWISASETDLRRQDIIASPRVGVAYASEDAKLPWRFRIRDNSYTSPAK